MPEDSLSKSKASLVVNHRLTSSEVDDARDRVLKQFQLASPTLGIPYPHTYEDLMQTMHDIGFSKYAYEEKKREAESN